MSRRVIGIMAALAAGNAFAIDRSPIQIIEDRCARAALQVNDVKTTGSDPSSLLAKLRSEKPSVREEMLDRMQAAEIERGLADVETGKPWDSAREAAACVERNRHMVLAYLTTE